MEAVWNVLELHRRFLKRDISKNYFLSKQSVSDEAEEVPETEETGELEKEQPADSNEQILELRRQGMSEVEIAKELGLGLGVIRLVIDLYEKEEQAV